MPFSASLRALAVAVLWTCSATISCAADTNFIVFFAYESAEPTPAALEVISDAAQVFRAKQGARIEVVGHTDTAESATLGNDRARMIRNELVRIGVPDNAISAKGKGSSEPMTPTAAGIREPTNRRATLTVKDR